ncbi:hypothetical protein [Alkalihalobacillus sp. BA299]|uniref:hypothetical protein n=1 Tax=Alkalihalobacillus sp. BA299 TaxID=2815938 RepID=UPI001ADB574F|nr:hypothetical protein [Alkalihalobacillus sp. BA299]
MQSWTKAKPSISIILNQEDNNYVRVKDFFTEEVKIVKATAEENEFYVGGLMLSIILPAGNTMMFFVSGMDLPSERTDKMSVKIMNLYKESGMEAMEFVDNQYKELENVLWEDVLELRQEL